MGLWSTNRGQRQLSRSACSRIGGHPTSELIQLRSRAGGVQVLKGGPVDTQRGFVLHSSDFFIENLTLPIDEGARLTATLDILKAIARGSGTAQRHPGTGLCRLGAWAARERDPA